MKKLIMGIAAIAATTAMAEIVSSSVVGYQNNTSRSGYNYITPTFRAVGASATGVDIQDMTIDSTVGPNEATMQFLGYNSHIVDEYVWLDAETAAVFGGTEGKGGWFVVDDDVGFALPATPVKLATGDSVLIDMAAKTVSFAGEVSDDDIAYAARSGYNYVGNAFPTELDIQNIRLSDSVGPNEATMQFLGSNSHIVDEYVWLDKDTAPAFGGTEGKGGWFVVDDDVGFAPPATPVILKASEAVLVDVAGSTITILAPFEI